MSLHANVNVFNVGHMKMALEVVKDFRKSLAQFVVVAKEKIDRQLQLGVEVVGLVDVAKFLQVFFTQLSRIERRFQKLHQRILTFS